MAQENNNDREREDVEFEATDRLVRGLRSLSNEQSVFVPRAVDERILRAAKQRLSKPAKTRAGWRWGLLIPSLGVATAILLVVALWHYPGRTFKGKFAREDINHDGKVDILDAFALARKMNGASKASSGPDINGDGVVDERDVQLIAAQAVKLAKGGRS